MHEKTRNIRDEIRATHGIAAIGLISRFSSEEMSLLGSIIKRALEDDNTLEMLVFANFLLANKDAQELVNTLLKSSPEKVWRQVIKEPKRNFNANKQQPKD